jgi:hypothetical protein
MGVLLGVGLLYFLFSKKKTTVNGNGNGGPPPPGILPDPDEPEAVQTVIHYHRSIVTPPPIPTIRTIRTARRRVRDIDKSIPTWVKSGWEGSKQAVALQGYLPEGEV